MTVIENIQPEHTGGIFGSVAPPKPRRFGIYSPLKAGSRIIANIRKHFVATTIGAQIGGLVMVLTGVGLSNVPLAVIGLVFLLLSGFYLLSLTLAPTNIMPRSKSPSSPSDGEISLP